MVQKVLSWKSWWRFYLYSRAQLNGLCQSVKMGNVFLDAQEEEENKTKTLLTNSQQCLFFLVQGKMYKIVICTVSVEVMAFLSRCDSVIIIKMEKIKNTFGLHLKFGQISENN